MAKGAGQQNGGAGSDRLGNHHRIRRKRARAEAAAIELEEDGQCAGVPGPGGDVVLLRDGRDQLRGFQFRRIIWLRGGTEYGSAPQPGRRAMRARSRLPTAMQDALAATAVFATSTSPQPLASPLTQMAVAGATMSGMDEIFALTAERLISHQVGRLAIGGDVIVRTGTPGG